MSLDFCFKALCSMCPPRAETLASFTPFKTFTPLFYGTVNQLLEFVDTGNLASINPALHDSPHPPIHEKGIIDSVIHLRSRGLG